jgi:acyl-CoA synthetase (AMP-forming)/AMP-acid ligase II
VVAVSGETFGEILRAHAERRPRQQALVFGERVWSYAEFHTESRRVATALAAAGVGAGDRVGYLGKNRPEYFTLFFGAALLRAVPVAVNWRLAAREMEYVLNHARARVLWIEPEFLGHLAQMRLECDARVVVIGSTDDDRAYERWIGAQPAAEDFSPALPSDTCSQLYTSGTTGFPKGVELTHASLLAALRAGQANWAIGPDTRSLVAMPLFHIGGSGWALAAFFAGGTNVLLREVVPSEVLRVIAAERISAAFLVPAVLQLLLAQPELARTDLSSLSRIVYGASPISEEVLVASMRALRCEFAQVYGLTETSGAITALAPEDHDPGGPRAELLRSAGKPWGDVELRIADAATGRALPEGQVGEVWCRSAQNLKGYWQNAEATAEVFPEGRDARGMGWFRTGDAGYLKAGYLFIHDRVKDMIVSGGENVYPAEVENALMAHPAIADCAVIGVPSERWGETVKAIVVLRASASDEDLFAWCRERLARFKCPTSIDRAASIPRNPSGKILKTELRKPYWAGRSRQVN